MKKLLAVCLILLVAWCSSCKKCFNCQNTCQQCVLQSNGSGFTLCQDSFASLQQFQAAIAADTALGYVCTATASSYNENFCSNKPGETYYPTYYNMGGRLTCIEK